MPSAISVREYQTGSPGAAWFPTITQSGALALVLARKRRQAGRLAVRDQRRQARRVCFQTFLKVLRRMPGVFGWMPFNPPPGGTSDDPQLRHRAA